MPFEITDEHIKSYHEFGYTIFRGIIPKPLLTDLRRESDKARQVARQKHGASAQRLQPIRNYPEVDSKPFEDFAHLPDIDSALKGILGPSAAYGQSGDRLAVLGVLFEPADKPWCTGWHRDWRDNAPGLDIALWEKRQHDLAMFNQVNCALYEDTCTWIVPASHLRRDTAAEIRRFPERPIHSPAIPDGSTSEDTEMICLNYARSMPGAFQAHLDAGDFMLYRNSLWHLGNYVPYKKRATIHDVIGTPEYTEWFKKPPLLRDEGGKPLPMQNANLDTPEYQEWKRSREVQPV